MKKHTRKVLQNPKEKKRTTQENHKSNSQSILESGQFRLIVENYKEPCHKGGGLTLLAMKDPASYLIYTQEAIITLIDNNIEIYSSTDWKEAGFVRDIIYVKPLNSYFLNNEEILFKKDIDENPPYPYMDIEFGFRLGSAFQFSEINNRLVINHLAKNLTVVDLELKRVELDIRCSEGYKILDFKILGEKENMVVSLYASRSVVLHTVNFELRKVCAVHRLKLKMIEERNEGVLSVAVCDKSEYLLVELAALSRGPGHCSRMLILKVQQFRLILLRVLDQHAELNESKFALGCCGYFGAKILWIGLSSWNGLVQAYEYDCDSGELKEFVEKRVYNWELWPCNFWRFGNEFYYAGQLTKIMKLAVQF